MLPEIPGRRAEYGREGELRRRLGRLFGLERANRFPGCQPVSFNSRHIKDELEKEDYFVSEKADGIRCLLFSFVDFGEAETFLIDRRNSFYQINTWLPDPQGRPLNNTVLDGELVLDVDPTTNEQTLWFLLFDAVIVCGKSLLDRGYDKRLGHLTELCIKPYKAYLHTNSDFASRQPFRMDLKKLQLSYGLAAVFEEIPKLHHKSDGIIFTSKNAPYVIGTCEKMIKWKPSDENSVDFRVRAERDREIGKLRFFLQIAHRNNVHRDVCEITLEENQRESWERYPPEGRIVECRYDPDWPNNWRFMRWRDDKRDANYIDTYNKVLDSIHDNVDKEELIAAAPTIRERWKEREANARQHRAN